MTNEQVISKILSGYRIQIPAEFPTEITAIMIKCWSLIPDNRPSFSVRKLKYFCFKKFLI